jgi:hypothetical protein
MSGMGRRKGPTLSPRPLPPTRCGFTPRGTWASKGMARCGNDVALQCFRLPARRPYQSGNYKLPGTGNDSTSTVLSGCAVIRQARAAGSRQVGADKPALAGLCRAWRSASQLPCHLSMAARCWPGPPANRKGSNDGQGDMAREVRPQQLTARMRRSGYVLRPVPRRPSWRRGQGSAGRNRTRAEVRLPLSRRCGRYAGPARAEKRRGDNQHGRRRTRPGSWSRGLNCRWLRPYAVSASAREGI